MVVLSRKLFGFGGNTEAVFVSLRASRRTHVTIVANSFTHLFASIVVSCQAVSRLVNFHLSCHIVYHLGKRQTRKITSFFPLKMSAVASFFHCSRVHNASI